MKLFKLNPLQRQMLIDIEKWQNDGPRLVVWKGRSITSTYSLLLADPHFRQLLEKRESSDK